ncbi:MAG: ribulose bisphosphate carboxylase small subunit [Phormidesmis sp.]
MSAIPRLSLPVSPQVSASADVHEFSLIEGDVHLGAGVSVAPGTAVTADQGASVWVGDRTRLLPGVIVEAIAGPQVMASSENKSYSIYLGADSAIAHKSLIHSPAFVGDSCFVGFRATLFNARLGNGCVVLSHALVQDVEIPPGRCVPSGAVITAQHQADQLPKVRPEDLAFAQEVMGQPTQSGARLISVQSSTRELSYSSGDNSPRNFSGGNASRKNYSQATNSQATHSQVTKGATMQAPRLSPDIVQQVRQHLSAGYRIGMEHADKRRYRSGVWETCTPVKETREQAVFEALERCLLEHRGEYVRMFGIDPKVKQRIGMVTVQRPGDPGVEKSSSASSSYGSSQSYGSNGSSNQRGGQSNGQLDSGIAQEVRNLLNAGYRIGTEHAGPRHYRSNVWKVCSPIESRNEREVFAKLEHCLDEHSGEYVRMFGINANANSRSATTTIQRADGKPVEIATRTVPTVDGGVKVQAGSYSQSSSEGGESLGDETSQAVGHIIRGGNVVGIEFADKRRYRSGIWQTAPSIKASSASSALIQLQNFVSENSDKYVRIFGVNSRMKTRGASMTIQKPGQRSSSGSQSSQRNNVSNSGKEAARDPINENPPHYDDPAFRGQPVSGGMDPDVANQVTQLLQQGHKVSIEIADKRRYRSGIWKTGPAIRGSRPADVVAELGNLLSQHSSDYVRLVGIDAKAKRRVAEVTIQKPGQKSSLNGSQNSGQRMSTSRRDPINANPPHYDDPAFRGQPSSYGQSGGYNSNGQSGRYNTQTGNYDGGGRSDGIESAVLDQVTQLVNQGHKISVEYADKRRYRSGIWKTGSAIAARRPAEAISELGKQLAQHQGEYVRLIGTDPDAKRRVLETTIQRP